LVNVADIDIIVPLFNEASGLKDFHHELFSELTKLSRTWRIIYVNDGSRDATQDILDELCSTDRRVAALRLSRNFGHQAALTAGLDHADSNIVIMMDGDGQHPPSLIHEMLSLYEAGYQIVQTKRIDVTESSSFFKRVTARMFYGLLSWLGDIELEAGAADFRLVSREVWTAVRSIQEYHRFLRGIFAWVGFRMVILPYRPRHRKHGTTKYSLKHMLRLAGDGLFSFSLTPLRVALSCGAILAGLAILEVLYIASFFLTGRQNVLVPGWSSLVLLLTICSSIEMFLLGIIGIYVGMIFQEVKRRPIYLLDQTPQTGRQDKGTECF